MLEAFASGDVNEAEERALALNEWLDKGGSPPQTISHPVPDTSFHREVARIAAQIVLSHCDRRQPA